MTNDKIVEDVMNLYDKGGSGFEIGTMLFENLILPAMEKNKVIVLKNVFHKIKVEIDKEQNPTIIAGMGRALRVVETMINEKAT